MDKVKYWLDLAKEDINVAKLLLGGGKYLYTGFICHLSTEKALKAVISKTETPEKIHDLVKLAKHRGIYAKMSDEQKDFLEVLLPLNIEGRYPSYKDNIAASLNDKRCKEILKETEALVSWIETQL